MKSVFIGCVEFSATLLNCLMTVEEIEIAGVVTRAASPGNADFCDLSPLAKSQGIDCLAADGLGEDAIAGWISAKRPEVVFCFGWSFLLKRAILDIPPLGVVGYHPAKLPANRGRHPIIWALALGLSETASTFFFMDEGADSGDILSQIPVSIEHQDDARSLYEKLSAVAVPQVCDLARSLADGSYARIPQDDGEANTWRKRGPRDGQIDWRMSAVGIRNLVRALAAPYPGAHCATESGCIKVWRVEVSAHAPSNAEPGKVLSVDERGITVKTGDGAVVLTDHGFSELPAQGDYL